MALAVVVPRARSRHVSTRHLLALVFVLAQFAAPDGWAHGDLHEAISALDREIAVRPEDAALYLRRGELHRKHEDWLKAAADYDRAAALDPSLAVVDLARGALDASTGRPVAARAALERFIRTRPDDPAGYAARARLSLRQKEPLGASVDFARAVALSREPAPELFLESAGALREAGKPGEAVAVLDAGTARLGPLVTLAEMALELELAQGRTDAALRRVDALITAAPRKEAWLYQRGMILEKAGRQVEARAACEQALAAIAMVPEYRRGTAATQDLQKAIEAALRRMRP